MSMFESPEPVNVTLLGERILENVIKDLDEIILDYLCGP